MPSAVLRHTTLSPSSPFAMPPKTIVDKRRTAAAASHTEESEKKRRETNERRIQNAKELKQLQRESEIDVVSRTIQDSEALYAFASHGGAEAPGPKPSRSKKNAWLLEAMKEKNDDGTVKKDGEGHFIPTEQVNTEDNFKLVRRTLRRASGIDGDAWASMGALLLSRMWA